MQTKKHSLLESLTNVIVGLLMSFLTQMIIYPILDIEVSLNQNIIITAVFLLYHLFVVMLFVEFLIKFNYEYNII